MTIAAGQSTVPWRIAAVATIAVAAVALRWELLGARSLWFDEGYTLRVVRDTLPGILRRLHAEDAHPPGYYALLWLWRSAVGPDLAASRGLSAIFGVASVALTGVLAARLFGFTVGAAAAALVAVNPFQIAASNELRMYMPLQAAVLVATLALHRAASSGAARTPWLAYGIAIAGAAYCSYYAGLLPPAHAAWLAVCRARRATWIGFAAALSLAAILYLPWTPGAASLVSRGFWPWRAPMWIGYVPELFATHAFGGYLFHMVTYQEWGQLALAFYPAVLAPAAILTGVGVRTLTGSDRRGGSLVVLSWVVPLALVIAASLSSGYVAAYHRHLVFLQPFVAIAIAGAFARLSLGPQARRDWIMPTVAAAVLAAYVIPAVDNFQANPAYQMYRFDQAADYLRRVHRRGDAVAFFPAGIEHSFLEYADPPGPKYAVGVPTRAWSRDAVRSAVDRLASTVGGRRVWVVISKPLPEGAGVELAAALARAGYSEGTFADFRGVGVALFARPASGR